MEVEQLIKAGANLNYKYESDEMAIHLAAKSGEPSIREIVNLH